MQAKTIRTRIIGSGGYVESAIARALDADGHDVHGLARSAEIADRIRAAGLTALEGSNGPCRAAFAEK